MNEKRKYKLKRLLRVTLWSLTAMGLFVLLLSAMRRNDRLPCKGLEILIDGYNHEMFISDAEVKRLLEKELAHPIKGTATEQLDLKKLERSLRRNPWISKVQIYIDNQQWMHVSIGERMPVARVFTRDGRSFYMDSSAVILPLSDNEIADVPVFTNVPNTPSPIDYGAGDKEKRPLTDSMLWQEVSNIGKFIKKDSFLLVQVGQVDMTPAGNYIIYPAIGNHWVEFGSGDRYEQKLQRLSAFYKKIFGKVGLNKYEIIDLRYDKQVVATLRGKPEGRVDSVAAMKTFEALVNKTIREANDTAARTETVKYEKLKPELITSQTMQPSDPGQASDDAVVNTPRTAPAPVVQEQKRSKPVVTTPKVAVAAKVQPAKPGKPKPIIKKTNTSSENNRPPGDNKKPKAVMPKQNDY